VCLSLCYLVLRRVIQIAALRFRSNDLKELEIVVLRHELAILPATHPPARDDVDRPPLPCGGQPSPAARTLAILHHHTEDAAALASALGGEAVDVRAFEAGAHRSAARSERWLSVSRETTRGGVINALSAN